MTYKEKGYKIIRNFLEEDFVKFIQNYFYIRIRSGGGGILKDTQSPGSYSFYSDPLIETIMDSATEAIAKEVGEELFPTYSYTRLYFMGEELKNHRDRPSCQLSATLSLGIPEGESPCPIYFCDNPEKENAHEIILNPGDLCIYKGCDLWHWRPPFTQTWSLQSFIHYVFANGEYKDHKWDDRPYLGIVKDLDGNHH